MAERVGDFEWRTEGEEAEIVLHTPDAPNFDKAVSAARMPGIENPVHCVSASQNFGCVSSSTTHVAPDVVSTPGRGALLAAGVSVYDLGVSPEELVRLVFRGLAEISPPGLGGAGVRRICEAGAWAAAEDGLIEEEDLEYFDLSSGDPDSLGRRAVAAGARDWDSQVEIRLHSVESLLDGEVADSLDLSQGALILAVQAGPGDLGRLAFATHKNRIYNRIRAGIDFDADDELPAAPLDTEEALDLLSANYAAANFADGRTALAVYALRKVLTDISDELRVVASWKTGGFEEKSGSALHRYGLAKLQRGEIIAAGYNLAVGTGEMLRSAPAFGTAEVEGVWPWEEAGLLGRVATLGDLSTGV